MTLRAEPEIFRMCPLFGYTALRAASRQAKLASVTPIEKMVLPSRIPRCAFRENRYRKRIANGRGTEVQEGLKIGRFEIRMQRDFRSLWP